MMPPSISVLDSQSAEELVCGALEVMMPPSISVLNSQSAEELVGGALEVMMPPSISVLSSVTPDDWEAAVIANNAKTEEDEEEVPAGQLDSDDAIMEEDEEEVTAYQQPKYGDVVEEGEKEDHKDEVLMRPNSVLEADPERVALAEMADWLCDEKFWFFFFRMPPIHLGEMKAWAENEADLIVETLGIKYKAGNLTCDIDVDMLKEADRATKISALLSKRRIKCSRGRSACKCRTREFDAAELVGDGNSGQPARHV